MILNVFEAVKCFAQVGDFGSVEANISAGVSEGEQTK